jgi:hypothetical protein
MALTINLPNTIEQNLRQAAAESGISLDGYIVQLLSKVKPKSSKNKALSETELLEKLPSIFQKQNGKHIGNWLICAVRKTLQTNNIRNF